VGDNVNTNIKTIIMIFAIGMFVLVGGITAVVGAKTKDDTALQFALVMANIVMVSIIALQAIATAEAVEQAKKQAELMNQSLLEMKKQRLNIEEFKNSLMPYLRSVILTLEANSKRKDYDIITDPYLYVLQGYRRGTRAKYLSPAEEGLVWRISVFIKKFLELRGLSWQRFEEYNKLVSKFKDSKTSQSEKPGLATRIKEKSKELLKTVESIFDEVEKMSNKELEEEILKILEA